MGNLVNVVSGVGLGSVQELILLLPKRLFHITNKMN